MCNLGTSEFSLEVREKSETSMVSIQKSLEHEKALDNKCMDISSADFDSEEELENWKSEAGKWFYKERVIEESSSEENNQEPIVKEEREPEKDDL